MVLVLERKTILICDKFEPEGVKALTEAGFEILQKATITSDELKEQISGVDIVIVRSRTKLTREILEAGKNLQLIGRPGTGVDNIDLEAAADLSIPVFTSVEASTNAVAELAIGLAVSLARSIPRVDAALKKDEWLKDFAMGTELRDKKFGIVGFGRIGRRTAKLASALEMEVLAFEKEIIESAKLTELNVRQVGLEELLRNSDFVSLHVPSTPETLHMIGKEQFDMMKKSAFLINTARGNLVVESDLFQALLQKMIAGAALDVFWKEPPVGNKLLKLPNVIATPHIGAQIIEAQRQASLQLAEKIVKFFQGDDWQSLNRQKDLQEPKMSSHAGARKFLK